MSMLKNIGIILAFLAFIFFFSYISFNPFNLGEVLFGVLLVMLPFSKGISIKEYSASKQKILAVINFFIFLLSFFFITIVTRIDLGPEDIGAIFLFLYIWYDTIFFVVAMAIRNQQPAK